MSDSRQNDVRDRLRFRPGRERVNVVRSLRAWRHYDVWIMAVLGVPLPDPEERRRLRLQASLEVQEVAARLGVHRQTVWSWESGTTEPRGRMRRKYAAFLTELQAAQEGDT